MCNAGRKLNSSYCTTYLSLSDEDEGALSGAGLAFLPRGFGGGFSALKMTQKKKKKKRVSFSIPMCLSRIPDIRVLTRIRLLPIQQNHPGSKTKYNRLAACWVHVAKRTFSPFLRPCGFLGGGSESESDLDPDWDSDPEMAGRGFSSSESLLAGL